jgi:hypothetical protein
MRRASKAQQERRKCNRRIGELSDFDGGCHPTIKNDGTTGKELQVEEWQVRPV